MNECSYFEYLGLRLVPYDQLPEGFYTISPEGERLRILSTAPWDSDGVRNHIPNLSTSVVTWPNLRYFSDFERFMGEYLSWEYLQPLFNLKITWDDGYKNYESSERRPGYQMRGKPVTPEQAFEIIRRTDYFFDSFKKDIPKPDDFISTGHFSVQWFDQSSYGYYCDHYGWCRPDGRIGLDDITSKWPDAKEFAETWCQLLYAFPFLDLIIIIWKLDEDIGTAVEEIDCGIYVHDNRVEFLNPKHAMEVFQHYNAQYGDEPKTYRRNYNIKRHLKWRKNPYLKRCIAANQQTIQQITQAFPTGTPCFNDPKTEE